MSASSPYVGLVQELYVAYFGRPADPAALQNFDAALNNIGAPTDATGLVAEYQTNTSVKSLVDAFGTSTESVNLYGSGSTENFVNAVFENLFNRPAAVAGLEFWTNAIDSGTVSKGQAALTILTGALQNTTAQGLTDQATLANKVAVAEFFTAGVQTSATVIAQYTGSSVTTETRLWLESVGATTEPASIDVQDSFYNFPPYLAGGIRNTYALTPTAETLVGGPTPAVYNAILDNSAGEAAGGQAPTLVTGDNISSTVSENIFNITDLGTGGTGTIPSGISISDMTEVNIMSNEGVSGDFSSWLGTSYLHVKQADGDVALAVGSDMVVTVIDTAGNVSIQGGLDVAVTTDSAHAVTIASAAQTFTAAAGDSTNTITDITTGASVNIAVGTGANTITLGGGASGTVLFAAHSAADEIMLGASGTSLTNIVKVMGLNNAGSDTIAFATEQASVFSHQPAATLVGFQQVTSANVTASGGNIASLQSWVAAADGAAGSGVSDDAHSVTWFVFQGNTYVLESPNGATADAGTMSADNTLVGLTGTGYSFSHATGAGGALHLLG